MVGDYSWYAVLNLHKKGVNEMKKLRVLAIGAVSLLPSVAMATDFEVPIAAVANLTPVVGWLGIAVVAYLALFGYRKFVKTANRT